MTLLTLSRRATLGCLVCCTLAISAGCAGTTELTTATVTATSSPNDTTAASLAEAAASTPDGVASSPAPPAPTIEPPATPAPTPAPSTSSSVGAAETVAPTPDQREAITYDHPDLGPVTISISYPDPTDGTGIVPTVRATVNATGETVFAWTGEDGYVSFNFAGAELNPTITNPVDGRDHAFFEWDPGRYPGVSYLVPTPAGFDSNGTMGESYSDGHYLALVVDTDDDGNYEVQQGFDNCDPSCADGYIYSHIWAWDGSAYTGSNVDPGRDAAEPLGDLSQLEPAKTAFTDYLLAVGARDYERAWGMLEPEYQDDYGGYDKFTAFWDTIDSVGIDSLDASWGYGYTILDGTLWFQPKDGTRQTEDVMVEMSYGNPPKIARYTSYGVVN